jgi:hypothetical protein
MKPAKSKENQKLGTETSFIFEKKWKIAKKRRFQQKTKYK